LKWHFLQWALALALQALGWLSFLFLSVWWFLLLGGYVPAPLWGGTMGHGADCTIPK